MDAIRRLRTQYHVYVEDIERDPTLLDECPHRHVYVLEKGSFSAERPVTLAAVFRAVETLENRGWNAVAWYLEGGHSPGVVMRRDPS